jgi:DnaJ-domain-containing protein 1
MLDRERRQHSFGGTRLVLAVYWVVGVSLILTLLFSEGLEALWAAVIAAIVLVLAAGLLLAVRSRRRQWERWRWEQKHRSRSERTRGNTAPANDEQQSPWWQVLEISERSTFEEVKAAYRRKIKQYHPDKVTDLAREFQELADRKTKEINRAFGQARRIERTTSPPER